MSFVVLAVGAAAGSEATARWLKAGGADERYCPPRWARLISKVYPVDPLRVPVDDEGREIQAG